MPGHKFYYDFVYHRCIERVFALCSGCYLDLKKPGSSFFLKDRSMKVKNIGIVFLLVFLPIVAIAQAPMQLDSTKTVIFAAMDATTSIGAAYATAVDLPDRTHVVILDNQTNGDVTVSMDGGTTDNFHLKAGDVLSLNLISSGLITTGVVQIKDGTTASSSGTFYVYSYK